MRTLIGNMEPPEENSERRSKAMKALRAAKYWDRESIGRDLEDGIVDLMADLLHLAHYRNIDLPGVLKKSQMHFKTEIYGGWS